MTERYRNRPFLMRVFGTLLRLPRWIGIGIELLILEFEGQVPSDTVTKGDFEFRFLTSDDVGELIRLEPGTTRQVIEDLFDAGNLCFGAWQGDRLVAKMWCDLDEIYHPVAPRKLEPDEVYLLRAYVDPAFRGRDLAPSLRVAGYAALKELGRNRFYSYSHYFNSAARRFKAKLGSQRECLIVHFRFFGKWSKCITLDRRSDRA